MNPSEKQSPRIEDDEGHLPAGAVGIIEATVRDFEVSEIPDKINVKKLRRRFGLLHATACVVAELAFAVGPR
ncbi:hypothetical protein JQ609_04310 [Bradyrhizobium sp. AUGA SZCCT0169]|uniref:hypothetical protein n=1 Tax=Bradyrhizobium sp. AUGA SZCCT0169 TaxID=2807663 RepID=UPI001BAC6D30|nr:hypothetical protein [Bradyrhizobium sp. AUGA SZCCT0169]MBR1246152.1 hypothetical protein [Bradyrhizobium sp. AUGA SZCCT0169]